MTTQQGSHRTAAVPFMCYYQVIPPEGTRVSYRVVMDRAAPSLACQGCSPLRFLSPSPNSRIPAEHPEVGRHSEPTSTRSRSELGPGLTGKTGRPRAEDVCPEGTARSLGSQHMQPQLWSSNATHTRIGRKNSVTIMATTDTGNSNCRSHDCHGNRSIDATTATRR